MDAVAEHFINNFNNFNIWHALLIDLFLAANIEHIPIDETMLFFNTLLFTRETYTGQTTTDILDFPIYISIAHSISRICFCGFFLSVSRVYSEKRFIIRCRFFLFERSKYGKK